MIVALFGSVGVGSAAGPCEGDDYEQYRNCTKKGTDSCSYRVSDFGSSRGRITKSVTTYKNGDKLIRVPDGSQTTYDGPPYFNSGDTYFLLMEINMLVAGDGHFTPVTDPKVKSMEKAPTPTLMAE